MIANQTTSLEVVTPERWARILSDHRRDYWPSPRARERRREKRVQLYATATVRFTPANGGESTTTFRSCPVLDVSADGLAFRAYQKIAPGTRLALELTLGGGSLALTGTVVQNSGFPGSIRVGVHLEFPAEEAEQQPTGG